MSVIKNWSESVAFQPSEISSPQTEQEVIATIHRAAKLGKKIRLIGSGHSFTPLIETSDIFMNLDGLSGVISVDEQTEIAEVYAGTKLKTLSEQLYARGYALANMGDINVQSVAGALLTGTHGTGAGFGVLATQIASLTMITASGEVLEIDEESQ
ncbi:MAG: FAD-binding protein, partial [Bacilli bacterium]